MSQRVGARRVVALGVLVVMLVIAGCNGPSDVLSPSEEGTTASADVTDTATPSGESSTSTPTSKTDLDGPLVGETVDLTAALLADSQLPSSYALSYRASDPEPLSGEPAPTTGTTNRFINQEAESGDVVLVQSVVARYSSRERAHQGLVTSLEQTTPDGSGEQRTGDTLGRYHATTFENEQGYTATMLLHRHGNVVHGVVVTGGSKSVTTAVELARLQFLQLQRLVN